MFNVHHILTNSFPVKCFCVDKKTGEKVVDPNLDVSNIVRSHC